MGSEMVVNMRRLVDRRFVVEVLAVFTVAMCVFLIAFPMLASSPTWQRILRDSFLSSGKVVGVFLVAHVLQRIFHKIRKTRKGSDSL